ncbi:MAG TPA: hypothetical protein VMU76_08780 [Acidimicrobiales bacterium]|nr:hypothetical protein [Acidimicrobiales bacterium]
MRPGKIVLVVAGSLVLLIGLGLTAGGGVLLWANATQRDAGGYFTTSAETLHTTGHALTSSLDFGTEPGPSGWVPYRHLGTLRITASLPGGSAVFVGIAATNRIDRYLANVAHDQVVKVQFFPFRPEYRHLSGTNAPTSPLGQGFWAVSATGTGTRTVTWTTEPGEWTVVVMRADTRPGFVATVSVGASAGWVMALGVALTIAGLLLLVGGGVMVGFGVAGLGHPGREGDGPEAGPDHRTVHPTGTGEGDAYPPRLDGPPVARPGAGGLP